MQKYIYILIKVFSINYLLRSNPNIKKTSFGQNKHNKNAFFFLLQAPAHHSLLFICILVQAEAHSLSL